MTIMVKRVDEMTFEVVNGHHRLHLGLATEKQVQVMDVETGEPMLVQKIDGRMVVLEMGATSMAAAQVAQVIRRAMSS